MGTSRRAPGIRPTPYPRDESAGLTSFILEILFATAGIAIDTQVRLGGLWIKSSTDPYENHFFWF